MNETVALYILIGWFILNALIAVMLVGKERHPSTPGQAVAALLVSATIIYLVLIVGGRV